ncbi:cob(I)yrinic acid a,c-diamide adenosyltransferase [Bdellovibrionota bacterium FG-1]
MKIYTKQGDAGETGLFGNVRVPKDDLRIQSYGALDELNAALGIVLARQELSSELRNQLSRIQAELFQLGAELATPRGKTTRVRLLGNSEIQHMEQDIDTMEAVLPPLSTFILPGGCLCSADLHLARTMSRRTEREMTSLHRAEPLRPVVLQYINRLSDFLFVCARVANHQQGVADIPWVAPT